VTVNPHLLLLDLDGTLYQGSEPIDGAAEALDELRGRGHTVRFLTNTDSQSTEQMLIKLAARNLTVAEAELFTSLTATEALLLAAGDVTVLPVANGDVRAQLGRRFRLTDGGAVVATHVVVGDVRDELSYPLLDTAFAALQEGARLIALQKGRFFLAGDRAHLDTGAVVAALEYAAGVAAEVAGKPNPMFLELAVASTGRPFAADRTWVVGDDATSDIAMARAAGVPGILVRTGKYARQRGLAGLPEPDRCIGSIADLPALLEAAGG
jgi:HAD superfamily hydrolase (TIGR01458 family)